MADPTATTRNLLDYAGAAEDAALQCNADKASALQILKEPE